MVQIPEQVIDDLRKSTRIVAATHVHPDGDALGSLLAFASLMESLGKEVFCLLEEPVSSLYSFLPGSERLHCNLDDYRRFVAESGGVVTGVSLDCGDEFRLGDKLGRELLPLNPLVVLDHHSSHQEFGTSRWVNVASSSTGEMVFELGELMGATLSYEAAFNLYVAIVTDTGSFRYECTSPRTLQIAGKLLECGVRAEEVSERIYDNYSPGRLWLLQKALDSVVLYEHNQIALMTVTQEMLRNTGTTMNDVETFINFPRSVETVKVAVLIKEGDAGNLSVSMRAKGEVDVAEIAKKFGGGGHRNAAGFRRQGMEIEELQRTLLEVVDKAVTDGAS